jgi:hypothetical protein
LTTDLARLLTAALQAGAEQMAKAAGVPLAEYQRIVLSRKWREALKDARANLDRQYKPEKVKGK